MRDIRVGVIGVGVLGNHHTRLYRQNSDVEFVGIFDADLERAAEVANEFEAVAFSSIDELMDAVECVSVAVPTHLHFDIASKLIIGGKHVLVEKPLTATVADGRELLNLAAENNVILQVGHVERYNPVIVYLENKIRSPRFIEAHRLANYPPPRPGLFPRGTEVGVVLDLMIHDIDVVMNLVKSEVADIDAIGIPILSRSEDIANARIRFKNGCVANLTASRVSQETVRKIRVFQSDAYLSLDYQEHKGEIVTLDGTNVTREPVPIGNDNALEMELNDFIRCVREARNSDTLPTPKVAAEHALEALEVADAISQQIRDRQPG